MSSALSFSAIRRIIFLVENDDRPTKQRNKSRTAKPKPPRSHRFKPPLVHSRWCAVYVLCKDIEPAPPLDYFSSLELALVYKGEVDDEDVRAIFAHRKPLEFWGCPRLIVSKIVEAFSKRQEEPAYLDVTITALEGFGAMRPSEAWSQVYRTHLPCHACTTVQNVQQWSIPHPKELRIVGTVGIAVETFHIASVDFAKQLTVELHYELTDEEEGKKKKE
ncbi:hypothetical protein AAVH_14549 [Aphelenchoides avenae]|nr:hypothetical protein AAVH_14549 [Aphelenchus avenae]